MRLLPADQHTFAYENDAVIAGLHEESGYRWYSVFHLSAGEGGVPKAWFIDDSQQELREAIFELKPEWRPTEGPHLILNPKPSLAKAKSNHPVRPVGWSILNHKPAALNIKVRRRPNPKDGGTR